MITSTVCVALSAAGLRKTQRKLPSSVTGIPLLQAVRWSSTSAV